MAVQNMTMNLGYKGAGSPNGVPAFNDTGAWTLGGIHTPSDTLQTPSFGKVVSVNPSATKDGVFWMGIPTDYVVLGVLMYEAGIAMNDPAKNDAYLSAQPLTVMNKGQMWLSSWTYTHVGAIDPIIGCKVVCNNTTGVIEFIPAGGTVATGWTAIPATVKSLSLDKTSAMLFLNF